MTHDTLAVADTLPDKLPDTKAVTPDKPQWTVVAPLVLVVLLDQSTKWWAWRADPTVTINFGGNPFVGATVGGWYASPVTGALLDLLGAVVLSVIVLMLLRTRYPAVVRVSAALAVGGWSSNLFDRLGMHYLTAPGSIRGAVDFIHFGDMYVNVADFVIVSATLVFLVAVGLRWTTSRLSAGVAVAPWARRRLRMPPRLVAAGMIGLLVAVTFGAAHYGGITAPGGGV
jgi:lipoprotein signal peptidase